VSQGGQISQSLELLNNEWSRRCLEESEATLLSHSIPGARCGVKQLVFPPPPHSLGRRAKEKWMGDSLQ
jgi:hypothetical protein